LVCRCFEKVLWHIITMPLSSTGGDGGSGWKTIIGVHPWRLRQLPETGSLSHSLTKFIFTV
jgi:hypothetical protein